MGVCTLIQDQATEVKVSLMQALPTLIESIGLNQLKDKVIPILLQSQNEAKNWRIKLAVLELVPSIANSFTK